MRKKIFRNWGLKLASLVLAFVLWFLVVQIEDPQDTKRFSNIPVRLTNTELLEKENKVYEVLGNTDTVQVTVRAPRSIISTLRASDIVAEADVSKLTDISTIAISYDVQNVEVDSIKGDHDVVQLNVEDRETKWIGVQYKTIGETAEDYIVTGVSLDQNRIEVTGPESAVEKISYAGVEVDVSGASANMTLNVEPQLYDADGNVLNLSNVKTTVSYIHMSVEVLATKEVPIELNVTGTPKEGYLATGVEESSLAAVRIAGTASALSNVTKISIPEEELDITDASADVVKTINIKEYLPDNIRLADSSFNGRVTVTVYIEPMLEKTYSLDTEDFDIVNVPEGYEAEIIESEEPYELKISGLEAALAEVQQEMLRGTIDIAAWMDEEEMEEPETGIYEIPMSFSLPEDVTVENEIILKLSFSKTEEI